MTSDIKSSESLLKLFSDDVVWDSSRFNVVLNMSAAECQVIAKRTSRQLRENSPKYVEAFKQLSNLHQSVATSSIYNFVSESNLAQGEVLDAAGEKVVRINKRRLDHAEEQLEEVAATINEYRQATGYRAFCLLAMGADGSVNTETKKAASALHMLNKAQRHHMEILLLTEKFKACQKMDPSSKVGLFADQIKTVHGLLDTHVEKSLNKLGRIDFLVNGLSTADLQESFLSTSQGHSDPALMTLVKADCATMVFRNSNRAITGELRQRVNNIADQICPSGRIFQRAA